MLLGTSSGGLTSAGTFWLFTAITLLGGAWAWFSIPETAGISLESMDKLFTLRWWQIGRYGAKEAERLEEVQDEKLAQIEKDGTATQVERV